MEKNEFEMHSQTKEKQRSSLSRFRVCKERQMIEDPIKKDEGSKREKEGSVFRLGWWT